MFAECTNNVGGTIPEDGTSGGKVAGILQIPHLLVAHRQNLLEERGLPSIQLQGLQIMHQVHL